MPHNFKTQKLNVFGMTCSNCETRIEKRLKLIDGIESVKVSYAKGQATVVYDDKKVSLLIIEDTVAALGYDLSNKQKNTPITITQLIAIIIIVIGGAVLLKLLGGLDFFNSFPKAQEGMGYGAIFVIGLLTSVHCIGMCGGISLSQCVTYTGCSKASKVKPSLLYNVGRVVSYTLIGSVVGALGSIISLSGIMRGTVALFAGVFMIIMGINMLNIFPWLRRFNLRLPKLLTDKISGNSPLYIGLLNGFMPCGPLQAMQLYALSTGSPIKGGISMLLFSLGTVPLMFSFGTISTLLSKKFTAKMMTASAVLIIFLGVGMVNTGMSMSGFLGIGTEVGEIEGFQPVMEDGYQIATSEVAPWSYEAITIKKDIPVRLNIHADAKSLNGCNGAIIIPEYGIQLPLYAGDNIIEFTPTEAGVFSYTCWMNMIRSSVTVVE